MAKRRVAILGASFDPPHFAHAAMAILALDDQVADEVWLCPSPSRWDKSQEAPMEMRARWAQMLADELRERGFPVSLCTEELTFGTFRGSWFFLHHLARKHPESDFRLLVGEDSWRTIPLWRDPVAGEQNGCRILRDFVVLVVPRPVNAPGEASAPLVVPPPHELLSPLSSHARRFVSILGVEDVSTLSSSELRQSEDSSHRHAPQGSPPEKEAHPRARRFCFPKIEEDVLREAPYRKGR